MNGSYISPRTRKEHLAPGRCGHPGDGRARISRNPRWDAMTPTGLSGVKHYLQALVDPMKRDGTESCPSMRVTLVIKTGVPPMTIAIDTRDICCAALELSKTNWVCAFAVAGDTKATVHKIKAREVGRLMSILNDGRAKAEGELGRPLQSVLRGRLRWFLACPASDRAGHSRNCFRPGELLDAASWPPRQNGSP